MWGLNKKQKDQITYFKSAVECSDDVALDFLKKANWDVDRACEIYYSDPSRQTASVAKASKKQEELYAKYKAKTEDKIDSDGLQALFSDLKVDPLDPVTLVFSMVCKAKIMGFYTKEEFLLGLVSTNRSESIKDLQTAFKNLQKKLTDENDFKEVYRFTFNFAKDSEKARNLNFDMAKALWEILLKDKFQWLNEWFEYLDSQKNKSDITKDTWNMLLEFHYATKGKIENYVDDGAWPVMIDEFVEFLKTKK